MRGRIGKFEILRTLGCGTMGEGILARDPDLGREVAIKTILQGSALGGILLAADAPAPVLGPGNQIQI